jgi:hypothetical protein
MANMKTTPELRELVSKRLKLRIDARLSKGLDKLNRDYAKDLARFKELEDAKEAMGEEEARLNKKLSRAAQEGYSYNSYGHEFSIDGVNMDIAVSRAIVALQYGDADIGSIEDAVKLGFEEWETARNTGKS